MLESVTGFIFSEYGLASWSGLATVHMFTDKRSLLAKTVMGTLFIGSVAAILDLV